MTSPQVNSDPTQGTKPCWVCGIAVPYQQGWCSDCWIALGQNRQDIVIMAKVATDRSLQGEVFMAVSNSLKRERKPPPPPPPKFTKGLRVNLDDLDVPFP